MSKRKKHSGKRRGRKRKDKTKKSHNKDSKDKAKEQKRASRKKKHALDNKNRHLKEEFKARRHRQDMIFIVFIVILALSMFGCYYFYSMYWDNGDEEQNIDTIKPKNDNNGGSDNGNGQADSNDINWYVYNTGMQLSNSNNKPVMIDFYFDGCHWCDELDKNVYTDSRVIVKAKSFVSIKVDIYEESSYNGPGLANQYNVQGCPTIIFLDSGGNEVNRIGGYEDANEFLSDMDEALSKS